MKEDVLAGREQVESELFGAAGFRGDGAERPGRADREA